jgi:hypothetical protein
LKWAVIDDETGLPKWLKLGYQIGWKRAAKIAKIGLKIGPF